MSTVVVGVDGSPASADAVTLGRRLARALGAGLVLVNAYPYETFDAAHERAEYEAWVRRQAHELLERLRSAAGVVPVRTLAVPTFSPARALFEAAGSEAAEAIVIGATHRAVHGHVAVGSVAERLLSGAPCPVVVAPHGYDGMARTSFDVVGVAYQPTTSGRAALSAAAALAGRCGARLRLLEVADPRVWRPDANAGRAAVEELTRAQHEVAERRLAEARAGLDPAVRGSTALLVGDPAEQLLTESSALDLLVCGSRDYGPVSGVHVGGVSKALMHGARCPVMIVPRTLASTPAFPDAQAPEHSAA
jgi:nucleotide-binding universal stress UspA family protein